MKNEFIGYEQSLALKELGFNEECLLLITHSGDSDYFTKEPYRSNAYLNGEKIDFEYAFPKYGESRYEVKIPLYQQAFRWFREKYNLHSQIEIDTEEEWTFSIYNIFKLDSLGVYGDQYDTYQETELECLSKLIEIAKKDDN